MGEKKYWNNTNDSNVTGLSVVIVLLKKVQWCSSDLGLALGLLNSPVL